MGLLIKFQKWWFLSIGCKTAGFSWLSLYLIGEEREIGIAHVKNNIATASLQKFSFSHMDNFQFVVLVNF